MAKWLYLAAAVVVFSAGYAFADALRTADIARLKAGYAAAAQKYQAELTKRETANAKNLADAVDKKQAEIDALDSQLAGMRSDVERLRRAASAGRGGVPAGAGSTCVSCERQVAECRRLLAESAGLLEEGGRMVGGLNADRAAVREALKPREGFLKIPTLFCKNPAGFMPAGDDFLYPLGESTGKLCGETSPKASFPQGSNPM